MLKKTTLLLLSCLAAAALPGAVSGQVDLVSRYIWRGFDLLHDNQAAVRPGFTIDFGDSGFAFNAWSSFAISDRDAFLAKYSCKLKRMERKSPPLSARASPISTSISGCR